MTLGAMGGMGVTLALAYSLLSFFVGCLYGAYAWERAHRDRPLREIVGLAGGGHDE